MAKQTTCDRCGDKTDKRATVYTDRGQLKKLVCQACEAAYSRWPALKGGK